MPTPAVTESARDETLRAADPDIDEAGVDREQIRRMLRLSPRERLRWLEEFMSSVLEIRRLNAKRTLR